VDGVPGRVSVRDTAHFRETTASCRKAASGSHSGFGIATAREAFGPPALRGSSCRGRRCVTYCAGGMEMATSTCSSAE
jgi:hypothetical protein